MTRMFSDDGLNKIDATEEIEPQALEQITRKLGHWAAPEVRPEQTAALVEMLSAELTSTTVQPRRRNLFDIWWVLILRAQIRVVQREIWSASCIVMVLGMVVTLASYSAGQNPSSLPFVLVAPLTTAFAISFLYGPTEEPAIEIELSTPVSQRLILLARLTLVFGFNLIIGLIGSLVLSLSGVSTPLWMLVALWLAPMTFLSALAFVGGAFTGNSGASLLISVLIWTTQVLRQQLMYVPDVPPLMSLLPDLFSVEALPLLFAMGIALVLFGLWIVGREERWLRTLNI